MGDSPNCYGFGCAFYCTEKYTVCCKSTFLISEQSAVTLRNCAKHQNADLLNLFINNNRRVYTILTKMEGSVS
jgi:hypothetical protein